MHVLRIKGARLKNRICTQIESIQHAFNTELQLCTRIQN